jgi:uncharacterized membrane protein YfcA
VTDAHAVALALIVTLAFLVEAAAGFGATLVTVTLASHFLAIDEVLARFLPLNLLLSLALVVREARHVDRAVLLRRVVAVMLPGMGLGLLLSGLRDAVALKACFGGFVLALSVRELRLLRTPTAAAGAPLSPLAATSALLGAGVVHGVFASGGPLLVYVVSRELPDKARFRATLSAVWLLLNSILLARHAAAGTVNTATLQQSATLLVPLLLGSLAGNAVHDRISPAHFRAGVFGLLAFAGASLLVRSLLALVG